MSGGRVDVERAQRAAAGGEEGGAPAFVGEAVPPESGQRVAQHYQRCFVLRSEEAVLVPGAVVDGRLQALCRQDAIVKEVCIEDDGRATYTLENVKTKNVYVAHEGEILPKAANRSAAKVAAETARGCAKVQLGRLENLAGAALATTAAAQALTTAAEA